MRKKVCFVMMPFGDAYDDYYKQIYLPAIEQTDLVSRRADNLYRPSPILHDIWDFINESTLVMADITGRNPNVMYELGLAHAIAKPAIIISNNIDDVPFDLRALRILLYDIIKPNWASELKNAIQNSIQEIIASPVDAVLPTFLNVRPAKQEDVSDIKKDLIEIKQHLYRINEEKSQEIDTKFKTKILDREEYSNAVVDAHRLYFQDGLDLSQIKDYLTSKYSISIHTASDIIDIARR